MSMDFTVLRCPKPIDVATGMEAIRCGRRLEIIERTACWSPRGRRYIVSVSCHRPKPDKPHFYHGEPRKYWLPREIAEAVAACLIQEDLAYLGRLADLIHTDEYDSLVHKFANAHNDAWPGEWDAFIRYLAEPGIPDDISSLVLSS